MEPYEALIDNQMPVSNQAPMTGYQTGPVSFPQFPGNDSLNSTGYGNLPPGMSGSYPGTPTTPVGNMGMGGVYSTPASQSAQSPYSSASSVSFSMPYDSSGNNNNGANTNSNTSGAHIVGSPTGPPSSAPQSNKPVYSCSYCGLVLSSNNALIEHKRIHTGERPYACHICDKRFTQKAHLNIHKRIHTGEKPYPCNICHKRFAQSSHLSSHVRIHTGEKPFVCGICHIGFTQKQRLDAHLKKHMERPGEPITVRTRAPSQPVIMTGPSQRLSDQLDGYRPGMPRDDGVNMMQMVGQGMPYIKQEVLDQNTNAAQPPARMEFDAVNGENNNRRNSMDVSTVASDDRLLDQRGRDGDPSKPDNSQNINAPSFSSEGMFLHPSGYVAYGGIEDEENEKASQNGKSLNNAISPSASTQGQQASSNATASSGHRRKSAFVRKRQSESPNKDNDENDDDDDLEVKPQMSNGVPGQMIGENSSEEVGGKSVNDGADNLVRDNVQGNYSGDQGNTHDMRSNRMHHGNENSILANNNPVLDRRNSVNAINGYSHHNNMMMNGTTMNQMNMTHPQTMSYSSAGNGTNNNNMSYANSNSNPDLVKVNSRVSLVNFTADELLCHLMKRDDVHCCRFCCLVFQDAAMYHIHRNMHDKQDIRRCNICGKTLTDKYDFTAHFLSMHKN